MTFRERLRTALLLPLVVMPGCAGQMASSADDPFGGGPGSEEVLLTVENNDFRDASIYVYWNGVRDRVGDVTGKTTETFRMRWRSNEVRLGIDFVSGGGDYTSETIGVDQGDHLNWVILSEYRGN